MTNQVNRTFALAAEQTHTEVRDHLVKVFTPLFKDQAATNVDKMAAWMGRNTAGVEDKDPER